MCILTEETLACFRFIFTCFPYRIARKVLLVVSKLWKSFKKRCFEIFMRAKVVNMKIVIKPLIKLVRNFEFSKFDNCKKLSVLAQILSFLQKIRVFPHKTFEQSKCRTYPSFFWTSDFFFFIHNLKIYNLTKHIYKNDTIGSMIGMATLNDLLTKNQYRY